ncbi:hypothetical protein GH714_004353 [Hevea brasiliensis]|uniref:Uncharacterized protein n=1 Tax=Hevea brasiliensis TaxID=3981 RepID=A0A6A6KYU0_HEVBR|nr:hypothetical protein GH714_004353 [Hevea brasiliensis]
MEKSVKKMPRKGKSDDTVKQSVDGSHALLQHRQTALVRFGGKQPSGNDTIPPQFDISALSTLEIKCVEMKRVDNIAVSFKEFVVNDIGEPIKGSSSGLCFSIEIKDAYIPSWIICRVCALMGYEEKSFEASFIIKRTSIGLNIARESMCKKTDSDIVARKDLQDSNHSISIPKATISPSMGSSYINGLKYSDGSYTVSLSSI